MTAFTSTSPTAGGDTSIWLQTIGGLVIDMIGLNGQRVLSQIAPGELFNGSFDTGHPANYQGDPGTIGIETGFTPALIASLGGGLSELAVRITLIDGDTAAGNFDHNENILLLNNIEIGNFSDVTTEQTNAQGTTTISTQLGFPTDVLSTGWFYTNDATTLANFFVTLGSEEVEAQFVDLDPFDNVLNFTHATDSDYDFVGFDPQEPVPPLPDSVLNDTRGIQYPTLAEAFAAAGPRQDIIVDETLYSGEPAAVTRADRMELWMDDWGGGHTTIVVATGANHFQHYGSADIHLRLTNGDKFGRTGDGDDIIRGFLGRNEIWAGGGNDNVASGDGIDFIYGEDGDDLLKGEGGNDQIDGGLGNDRLFGGGGNDGLGAGDGADTVVGGQGSDLIVAGNGDDRIWLGDVDGLGDGVLDYYYKVPSTGRDRVWGFDDDIDVLAILDVTGIDDLVFTDDAANNRVIISYAADGPLTVDSPRLIVVYGMTAATIIDDVQVPQ